MLAAICATCAGLWVLTFSSSRSSRSSAISSRLSLGVKANRLATVLLLGVDRARLGVGEERGGGRQARVLPLDQRQQADERPLVRGGREVHVVPQRHPVVGAVRQRPLLRWRQQPVDV